VERRFQQESIAASLGIIRLYLVAAVALYLTFGILDVITDDPSLKILLFIRCAIVTPILLGSCAATFHPNFPKYSQPILAFAMMSPGLAMLAWRMMTVSPSKMPASIIESPFTRISTVCDGRSIR